MNKLKLVVLPTMAGAVILASATVATAAGTTTTITVTPSTGLTDGQTVTVTGQGFPASTTHHPVPARMLEPDQGRL